MVKLQFYPIDLDYMEINSKPIIRIFGRTLKGERVCCLDDSFTPYFYVIPKKGSNIVSIMESIEKLKFKEYAVTETDLVDKNYLNNKLKAIKVYVNLPKAIKNILNEIKEISGIEEEKEIDIPFVRRYLIDKKITPLILADVEGEIINTNLDVDLCIKVDSISQNSDSIIKDPRVLAFDIEVYNIRKNPNPEKDQILMVSFAGSDGFKKVIIWKKFDNAKKYVEFVEDESDLINKFIETVKEYKPDYLVGYFSDGFDLPYLSSRASFYNIKLNLGLDKTKVKISSRQENLTAKIKGICHIDVFKFIKRIMSGELELESYDLDSVARLFLGEGKGPVAIEELAKVWDKNKSRLNEFCEYNLKDSLLALQLFEKILPNLNELIKIVSQPPYEVCRMSYGQLVEWYLIKMVQNFNELIPNRPKYESINARMHESYEGAFVYQPNPGLYKDLVVLDFRSLYLTIITSHNICPSTITENKKEAKPCPEILMKGKKVEYYFSYKKDGFIPIILKDLIERRNRIKEMLKKEKKKDPVLEARRETLKILLNSFYGYLGFSGARWYSNECAAAVTSWGRYYIQNLIEKAKKNNFQVIYGDTDGIFLSLENKKKENAIRFLKEVNAELPSLMELELENFYARGLFVMKKSGKKGAKKKYALLDESGKMKIKGFETVRGDWSDLARETQHKVLEIILKENNNTKALEYVKAILKKVKNKKIEMEKMIIRRQLKKEISRYETIGPHVTVAKRMQDMGLGVGSGSTIPFIVNEGKGVIRDKAKLPEESDSYDSEYYIHNQVIPVVETIFEAIGIGKDELINDHKQKKLGEF